MNKIMLKRIFRFLLGLIIIFVVGVVSLWIDLFRPYDFELNNENKTLYEYSINREELEENITAYKKVSATLYVQGKCGFWIINLKKKEIKLLNKSVSSADLNKDDSKKNKRILGRTEQIKKKYGDSLIILDSLDQLSFKEQKIYDELNNSSQGNGVVYTKEQLRSNYYGPYYQPLEYLLN